MLTNNDIIKEHTCVFFHGFPGYNSRHHNLGIASFLKSHFNIATAVHKYPGLDDLENAFSFYGSLSNAAAHIKQLELNAKKTLLIGHSWGGFVCLFLLQQHWTHINKVILLSPLIKFWSQSKDSEMITAFLSREKPFWSNKLLDSASSNLHDELTLLREQDSGDNLLNRLRLNNIQLYILQANQDRIIHPETTKAYMKLLSSKVKYHELNDSHSFNNKKMLFDALTRCLT